VILELLAVATIEKGIERACKEEEGPKLGFNKKTSLLGCCCKKISQTEKGPAYKKKKEPVSRNNASDWIVPLIDVTRTLIGVLNQA
jgi:hypothetical protein